MKQQEISDAQLKLIIKLAKRKDTVISENDEDLSRLEEMIKRERHNLVYS